MKLLDTSALIENIKSGTYEVGAISVITLLEMLRGVNEEKRNELKKELEAAFPIIPLRNDVILEYCKLYRKIREEGKLVPEADLLIAATAIATNLTLKTKDKHFLNIDKHGLRLEYI